MANLNWDDIEASTASQYKDYAAEGKYKVKLDHVDVHEAGSKGNYAIDLFFEETPTTQYQKATYWLSKEKQNWRVKVAKDLLTVLSGNEDNAKKACELAESKDDFTYATKAYQKAFDALAAKHPEVEIEVYFSGMYSQKGTPLNNATLTDPRVYNKRDNNSSNPMAGAVEVDLSADDELGGMPF